MTVAIRLYAEHGVGSHFLDADGYPWSSLWASEPFRCELCGRTTQTGFTTPYGVDLCRRCIEFAGHVLDCPSCGARFVWEGKLPPPSRMPRCGAVIAVLLRTGRQRRCKARIGVMAHPLDVHRRS